MGLVNQSQYEADIEDWKRMVLEEMEGLVGLPYSSCSTFMLPHFKTGCIIMILNNYVQHIRRLHWSALKRRYW